MSDLISDLLREGLEFGVDKFTKDLLKKAEIKGKVNGKFITDLCLNKDFLNQFKRSYVYYKDSRLELVLSKPGYESITIDTNQKLKLEGFRMLGEKQKTITYEYCNGRTAKLIINPKDDLNQYLRLEF